jgi:hypothetical protein
MSRDKVYGFRFDGVNRILVQGTWSRGDLVGSASAMKASVVLSEQISVLSLGSLSMSGSFSLI